MPIHGDTEALDLLPHPKVWTERMSIQARIYLRSAGLQVFKKDCEDALRTMASSLRRFC